MIENNLTKEEIVYAIRQLKEDKCQHLGCPRDVELAEEIRDYEWLLNE